MKFEKTFKKVKQERKTLKKASCAKETALKSAKDVDVNNANGGRRPPVYSESKAIDLDLKKLEENRIVCMDPLKLESEYYKVLRTSIQQRTYEQNWNTIMVTSVQPGEGKTLTSINLAISFAKAFDQTVLLVDCDLKRQSVHRYLDFKMDKGLIDYLTTGCELKELIVWPKIDKLTVISGGKTTIESAEHMGSLRMKRFVDEVKHRYDDRYVFFDVPPILSGADTIAFAPMVDGILMVVEEGRTSQKELLDALELIPVDKFLGFVLNRRKNPPRIYYY